MIKELEITVQVLCNYDELHKILVKNDFIIKEEYQLNDIYMINKDYKIDKLKPLETLKKCILVRDIVGIEKLLLYKYKKYDDKENIIEQGKVKCPVFDIEKAISFMECINYKKLITIKDKCIVYCNNDIEIVVQLVNDKYIFIEMEDKSEYISRKFNNIDEMIKAFNKYDLPIKKNNYFIKKAEMILKDKEDNN